MISIVHLLDDFAMGGVTQALKLFDNPRLARHATSQKVVMERRADKAPKLQADLIVIHVPAQWARLPYLFALRLRNPGARIVHVEHSYTRAFEKRHVTSKARFRLLLKLAAWVVDEVIAVSNAQRAWLVEVGVPSSKLSVIYPWCDREHLQKIPDLKRTRSPIKLLSYGRLSEEKNYASLIEAMLLFGPHEVDLTIFGAGPEQSRLEELSCDTDNVHLHPACSDPAPWLKDCDAVIVPSHREAFGLAATEARMAGRPLLVANVDGLPEQAGDDAGLVLPLNDAHEIELAIKQLLEADLPYMGLAARAGVRDQNRAIISGWRAVIERAALSDETRDYSFGSATRHA